MRYTTYKNTTSLASALLAVAAGALILSCNQEFSKVIPETEPVDSVEVAFGSPRVLYIIADGARGKSVREGEFTHIHSLLPNAIYSWESLSDEETSPEEGTNWADLLTGVQKNKHGVIGNDYSNANLESYPLIFERIKEASPTSNLQVYTSSTAFYDHLTAGADTRALLDNDAAVQTAVADALAEDDITVVTAHYTDVDEAGR